MLDARQEDGKERLTNWGRYMRLDSSDTGYPSRCTYWTPPRTGEIYTDDDPLPDVDILDAEAVDRLVRRMPYSLLTACRLYYWRQRGVGAIRRELNCSFESAIDFLRAAEKEVGRKI